MKQLLTILMLGNAALFVFGALQLAGVVIGSLSEPVIIPASIAELLCALALIWGVVAVLTGSLKAWRSALIGNLIAIAGVAIGMVALRESDRDSRCGDWHGCARLRCRSTNCQQ